MADSVRARLGDPHRIAETRRLLAQARREALDRLAALSARLLGAADGQIALIAEAPVMLTPGPPVADEVLLDAFANPEPLAQPTFLAVPIEVAGARVGVLGVQAAEPREWTHHDTETLRELAGTVAAELDR